MALKIRALILPRPALILPLPVDRFPNKLVPKVLYNIPINPPFCSFASFLIVSLTSFINKPDSSSDLTIFIMSFTSSFEIISVLIPDLNIFLWIVACVADVAAANSNGVKTILANCFSHWV